MAGQRSPSARVAIVASGADAEKAEAEPSATPCSLYAADLRVILRLGWPNSVNMFLTFMPGLVMLTFLGSDADQLAAAGMGFMFANVSGLSLILGSGAGATPLISQAFGARNFVRCGGLLQRQIAIHAVLVVLIALVWLNTEQILVACRQPAAVAKLTGQFMRWRVAALPFFAVKEDLTNYLAAQRVTMWPMVTSVVANVLNVAAFPLLIGWFGFPGAPLAMTLANVLQALALWGCARRALPQAEAWPSWSLREALTGWGEILRMSLPAGVMMLSEWWGWETNLFFAGLLCTDAPGAPCLPLDVFPIASNTMVVAFMFQYGFSLAAGTLVGNALGEGDAPKARRVSKLALWLAAGITGFVCLVLLRVRREWGRIFTADPAVVELTGRVLPLVAAYVFLDALGPGALVSILRGMGLVRLPSLITFVSFYLIGIPFGLCLAFGRGMGILGLWAGLVLGMLTMVASLLAFFSWGVDWRAASREAQARSGAEALPEAPKVAAAGLAKAARAAALGKKAYGRLAEEGGPTGQEAAGAAPLGGAGSVAA